MAGNFVGHARHKCSFIYHDEGSSNWWTHDNVVDQPKSQMPPICQGVWPCNEMPGHYDFLAAWASSERNIMIHDLWTRDLNQSNVYGCFPPPLKATCGNNITTRNIVVLPGGATWPAAAQAVIDGAGARIKSDDAAGDSLARATAALAVVLLLLPSATARLVFDSVSHLGSLPGKRADADFLLSFMNIGRDQGGTTRFVVSKAPNGSVVTSVTGGISWELQSQPSSIPVGSYATIPTVYQNLGGWPPSSGLPLAYAAVSLPATYEPPAPANFTYTGTRITLSAKFCSANESDDAVFHTSTGPVGAVRYTGLPAAAVQFLPGDGNVVRLENGTWISTVSVWFARDAPMNLSDPHIKCCNVSVTIFRSDDSSAGYVWEYVATVATPQKFRSAGGDEGPNGQFPVVDCHFADTPSSSTLKHLLYGEGGAAE